MTWAAQAKLYPRLLAAMKPGATLGLSHGFLLGAMRNDEKDFREDINVILVAPKVRQPAAGACPCQCQGLLRDLPRPEACEGAPAWTRGPAALFGVTALQWHSFGVHSGGPPGEAEHQAGLDSGVPRMCLLYCLLGKDRSSSILMGLKLKHSLRTVMCSSVGSGDAHCWSSGFWRLGGAAEPGSCSGGWC